MTRLLVVGTASIGLMLFDYIDRQVIVSLFPYLKAERAIIDHLGRNLAKMVTDAERDTVDPFASLVQVGHSREDAAVLFEAEIVGLERSGGLNVEAVVQQNGAEHESLGVDIRG